jgi:hypothetical protein
MAKERNDYSGPIEDRAPLEEFSKEFLLKLMRLWGELWEAFTAEVTRRGAEMEGVGPEKAGELVASAMETVTPPIFARVAQLAKVDVNTVEGRMKAGGLCMDNMYDHYPGHYEVKSNKEVILTYTQCHVMDKKTVGDIDVLRYICQYVDPRFAMAYLNYPGAREIKVTMLKVPESLTPKPGEPVCIWRFAFEE